MVSIKNVLLTGCIIFTIPFNSIANDELKQQEAALNVIADFADRICNKIPLSGSSENIELSGAAKVELNNLLKKIADMGVEGAAKYQQSEYANVLQKDLANLVNESSKCKREVWLDLKDKLLVSKNNTSQKNKSKPEINVNWGPAYPLGKIPRIKECDCIVVLKQPEEDDNQMVIPKGAKMVIMNQCKDDVTIVLSKNMQPSLSHEPGYEQIGRLFGVAIIGHKQRAVADYSLAYGGGVSVKNCPNS